jgi:Protein of unknown function (DUF2442)
MSSPWRINAIKVLKDQDHTLWVQFKDGTNGIVRFMPGFFRGVFAHLIDPLLFSTATVVDGAVTWPGGLDLAPDAMHHEIKLHGEWIIDQ